MTTEARRRHWMTPKRRFISAMFGGRVDRVPVGNPTSVACLDLMDATGAAFPEAHLDAEKMARLAAASYEILGYDTIMPVYSVHTETAAMGAEMNWGTRDTWPACTNHPIEDPRQVVIPADFLDRPSMRTVLDAVRILKREYGDYVTIIGKAIGPWSIGYHLVGTENFLIDTILDPDKIHAYVRAFLQASLLSAKAQIKAGADVIMWADHATGDLVSAKCYHDFLMAVHQEVTATLGAPLILHICGNTTDRLPFIVAAGWDCFHFDSKVDARVAKEIVGDRMSLVGNVNNPTTLMRGSPEDVRRETLYALEAGVEIAAPECAIPLVTPAANLKAITEAALEFSERNSI